MTNFLDQVRKSMSVSRRTETVPQDWIYALTSNGITGSSTLEAHLDTGEMPPSLLQPHFSPPDPSEPPPPDLEALLGTLSGKAEKESKKYIPSHFPPFPSQHTYKSTPVFAEREDDPRKIREKASKEGIEAEKSLRKLMAAQKLGLQNRKGGKRKRSKRMKKSDELWKAAMEDCLKDEADREEKERQQRASRRADDMAEYEDIEPEDLSQPALPKRKVNLEEGVHVNYGRKYWRKSARGP
jgi:transcription initiation factor TFIID subunit 8